MLRYTHFMSYRLWREVKEPVPPGTEARMAESRVSAVDLEQEEDEPVLLGHLVVVSYIKLLCSVQEPPPPPLFPLAVVL